jgi:hypothetical protein
MLLVANRSVAVIAAQPLEFRVPRSPLKYGSASNALTMPTGAPSLLAEA